MKTAIYAVAAALALNLTPGASRAQPLPSLGPPSVAPLKISLKFKDVALADLVDAIAREGGLQVVLEPGAGGTIKWVSLRDVTPEQALRQVARLARLEVRALSKTSFVVSAPLPAAPASASAPRGESVLRPVDDLRQANDRLLRQSVKPYVLRVRLAPGPDAVEQEIEVAAKDTFSLACLAGGVRYSIRGTLAPPPDAPAELRLSLRIERWAPGQNGAPAAKASIVTQLRLLPDGREIAVGGTSVRPGAPAPLAPSISLHANAEANAQADAPIEAPADGEAGLPKQ